MKNIISFSEYLAEAVVRFPLTGKAAEKFHDIVDDLEDSGTGSDFKKFKNKGISKKCGNVQDLGKPCSKCGQNDLEPLQPLMDIYFRR